LPPGIQRELLRQQNLWILIVSPHPPEASDKIMQRWPDDDRMVVFIDPPSASRLIPWPYFLKADHISLMLGRRTAGASTKPLSGARKSAPYQRRRVSKTFGFASLLYGYRRCWQ